MITKFNNFINESKEDIVTLNFGGSYSGDFKKVEDGWSIVKGIFPLDVAKKIIKEVNPTHDTEKKAGIGITHKGYGLESYFTDFAAGGYLPSRNMVISDKLFNDIKTEQIKESNLYESIDNVTKNSDGTITYRGEEYPGFNKPKKYTGKGKYKKRVLAKEGDKIKVINYGHKDYEDYTIHKDSDRRKSFRARHKCDPVSNLSKLTARYWACQDLW